MPNYRIEPLHTKIYQTDTLGFYIKAKDIDDLRRKLIQRDSDAGIFQVLASNSYRCIGNLIKKNLEKGKFVTLGHVDREMIVKTKKRMYFWNPSKIHGGREQPIDKATGKVIRPKSTITVKKDSPSTRAWTKAGELIADAITVIPWSL